MSKRKRPDDSTSAEHWSEVVGGPCSWKYPFKPDSFEYNACEHGNEDGLRNISAIFEDAAKALRNPRSAVKTRRNVGNLVRAVTNEGICPVCRFLVDALKLRRKDSALPDFDREADVFLRIDTQPWYKTVGLEADRESKHCAYTWLEVGSDQKSDQPKICVALLPEPPIDVGISLKNGIYPRRRPPIEANWGSAQYTVVREWLRKCDDNHNASCKPEAIDLGNNFKVIDVKEGSLVSYEEGMTFLTLSYVWGKNISQKNYWEQNNEYRRKGKLPPLENLPETMLNAIQVTEKLGQKYLWIDVFCIDQIDEEEKQRGLDAMVAIFASSWLTIVAVDGASSDHGISGLSRSRPLTRIRQPWLRIPDGILMATYIHTQEVYDGNTPWNKRAWTLQERLLSRRCLFLTDDYFSMQCKQEVFHDLIGPTFTTENNTPTTGEGTPTAEDIAVWPEQTFTLREDVFWKDGSGLDLDDKTWKFETYAKLVSIFTARDITNQNDIHDACRGSLQRITDRTRKEFVFALPKDKDDLLQSLMWTSRPHSSPERRIGFPTWSWLGWVGHSEYPDWLWTGRFGSTMDGSSGSNFEHRFQEMNLRNSRSNIRQQLRGYRAKIEHNPTTVIQLKTLSCNFEAIKVSHDQSPDNSVLWTLRGANHERLPAYILRSGEKDSEQFFSLCLSPAQSREIERQQNKVQLILLQHWTEVGSKRGIISALVVVKDRNDNYQRLDSVVVSEDVWPLHESEESSFTLI